MYFSYSFFPYMDTVLPVTESPDESPGEGVLETLVRVPQSTSRCSVKCFADRTHSPRGEVGWNGHDPQFPPCLCLCPSVACTLSLRVSVGVAGPVE